MRVETLAAALRLLGVLPGEVARDVVLLARDLLLLLVELPLLRESPQRALLDERCVAAGVRRRANRPRSAARDRRPPRETRDRG